MRSKAQATQGRASAARAGRISRKSVTPDLYASIAGSTLFECDAIGAAGSVAWPKSAQPFPRMRGRKRANPLVTHVRDIEPRAAVSVTHDASAHVRAARFYARPWEVIVSGAHVPTLPQIEATAHAITQRARAKFEGGGRAFPLASWDYKEEVASAMREELARALRAFDIASNAPARHARMAARACAVHPCTPRTIVAAGARAGARTLRKMSTAEATDPAALAFLPQVSDRPEDSSGAGAYAMRAAIVKRARVLRARAFYVFARACEDARGKRPDVARAKARAALRADLQWIMRAFRYMRAQVDGRGYSLRHAFGVSPAGKRGGRAPEEQSAWTRMQLSFARTCARLGVAPITRATAAHWLATRAEERARAEAQP
jgi:hypothetical protein